MEISRTFAGSESPAGSRGVRECNRGETGQGRSRTADTVIFSHVLYQLSYLPGRPYQQHFAQPTSNVMRRHVLSSP